MIPNWPIQIVPTIEAPWMDVREDTVLALAQGLNEAHPTAGRHYCAFRTLSLLVWQPVFLTMAATHLAGVYLRQSCIAQQAESCMGWGCEIADHMAAEGQEAALFSEAVYDLNAGLKAAVGACAETLKIHNKAASRLLGDCITGATLAIKRRRPEWSCQQAAEWGRRWLNALQLGDAAGFFSFSDSAGCRHFSHGTKGVLPFIQNWRGRSVRHMPQNPRTRADRSSTAVSTAPRVARSIGVAGGLTEKGLGSKLSRGL